LLQINDAAFPIGGYSHSYGLESYIQFGLVKDAQTAADYIRRNLDGPFLFSELLPARIAYDLAARGDVAGLIGLEELSVAARAPAELRAAAQKIGQRFIKTAGGLLQNDDRAAAGAAAAATEVFSDYVRAAGHRLCTHPVAYGVFCAAAGFSRREALAAFLYAQTSAAVVNCVKTVPLRQTDGQRILAERHAQLHSLLDRLDGLAEADAFRSFPGHEIRAMQHEGLYSRLYMS
jgi:urease accessory protein